MTRHWHIQGFESLSPIFETKVSIGRITESQLKALLMTLTAKAGLNFNEIVGAYVKKRTKSSNNRLAVQRDGPYSVFSCGDNPHFIARVVDDA